SSGNAKGQKRISCHLFNQLIRSPDERIWDGNAECFGSLEIDNQLDFDRLLDRQVRGLLATENFASVEAQLAVRICETGSVAHQTAGHDEVAQIRNHRDGMAGR